MVIDANIKQKEILKYLFHEMDNFEVNCFCQININKGNNIVKTKYFFIGGLDSDKKEGKIKLYRIIFDESFNYDIEFLQDIVFCKNNTFEGFDGSINCIIQLKNSGKLLVSFWDGQILCLVLLTLIAIQKTKKMIWIYLIINDLELNYMIFIFLFIKIFIVLIL